MKKTLKIGAQIAEALDRLHRANLVYQKVGPDTIRVDPESDHAELLGAVEDRSPAFLRARPETGLRPEMLPYMSPEQTGRMNRPLDQRSDLYSLGVVLYEMIAGAPPFAAEDMLGWVHCHIAVAPQPLDEVATETPPVVSEIVMKLLAKLAEARYQSARGLMVDLEKCVAALEEHGEIEPFPIGAHDVFDRLRIPAKLYGREGEIKELFASFERVVEAGVPGVALVAGYSGIGKSSLVQELHRPIVRVRGFFLTGKFDQYKRDIPYFTMGQAFREIVRQLLGESEEKLEAWRSHLRDALGKNGQLIVDVIPQLALILGEQPPVAPLPNNEAQGRMNATFQSFIGVFAKREHPLALFLDDLQWADLASLNLLHHLLTSPGTQHLFVLGAYRDNEVSPSHPLVTALAELRKANVSITELTLGPLSAAHVNELVGDTLRCSSKSAEPLSNLVFTKTAGNPFFVTQLLLELYQQRLLRFDAEAAVWRSDIERIEAMSYTDNVVELIVGKLKRLPEEVQDTLKLAACIGNEFELHIAAVILSQDLEETRKSLEPAFAEGLILGRGDTCKFLHDRVQQAAYTLIPEDQRAVVHLRVGRLLWEGTSESEREERVFDIVNQLNLGASRIVEREERLRVAQLNLRAGKKAKASAAHKSAATFLSAGLAMLDEARWESDYALMYAIHKELAECEIVNGRLDEAEQLGAIVQGRAAATLERAAIYQLRMQIRATRGAYEESIALGIECLKLFGVELPLEPSEEDLAQAIKAIDESLGGRSIEDLLELPLVTDPASDASMSTLSMLYFAMVFTARARLTDLVICRMVSASIANGNAAASTLGYALFGSNVKVPAGDFRSGYRFAKLAYDLVDKHQFVSFRAQACNILCSMVSHWTRHYRDTFRYAREGVQAGIETGNVLYTCINSVQATMAALVKGDPLDQVRAESATCLDFLTNAQLLFVVDIPVSIQRFALNMTGLTEHLSTWSSEGFDEAAYSANLSKAGVPIVRSYCHTLRAMAWFLSGDYKQAFDEGRAAKEFIASAPSQMPAGECCFFTALAAASYWNDADEDERRACVELLSEHEQKLRVWASSCPDNYLGKHALVSAEIARIEGRELEAARLYDDAIRAFRASGFGHNEGMANEAAARFYLERGFLTIPDAYLREAMSCFNRWGAEGKVRQLRWLYPEVLGHEQPSMMPRELAMQADQLDTVTAVKASKALSGETVPDKLLASLMRILVEHASAQRCCLLLPHDGGMSVSAEATAGPRGIEVQLAGSGAALSTSTLPMSIVNYVKRTREKVLLDDASAKDATAPDEYITRVRPKSVLCLPIMRHGEIEGVLYLENRLVTGAFTPRRLALLEFLAVVSLENATLTAELEQENAVRKRAERTLRESEERLRKLIETANLIPWESDSVSGRFTYLGPQVVKLLGYPQQEWQDQSASAFLGEHVHPDDRDEALARFFDQESENDHFDVRMIAADGRTLWLHNVVSAASRDEGGTAFSGFLIDITERKRVESTLRDQLDTIQRQQEAIRSLSAPIIEVWEGVLTMPVFGPIDGHRAQQMMEVLLAAVVRTRCRDTIIDLTGVETVDAGTADHIVKIVNAVKLLGSHGIVVGIRPEVARTMISIGVDLSSILTLSNLREALLLCMNRRAGHTTERLKSAARRDRTK